MFKDDSTFLEKIEILRENGFRRRETVGGSCENSTSDNLVRTGFISVNNKVTTHVKKGVYLKNKITGKVRFVDHGAMRISGLCRRVDYWFQLWRWLNGRKPGLYRIIPFKLDWYKSDWEPGDITNFWRRVKRAGVPVLMYTWVLEHTTVAGILHAHCDLVTLASVHVPYFDKEGFWVKGGSTISKAVPNPEYLKGNYLKKQSQKSQPYGKGQRVCGVYVWTGLFTPGEMRYY